jgi:hypothetical protein
MTNPPRSQTNWQIPRELPDLRRVGIIALDTETRDEGLQADRGSLAMGRRIRLRHQQRLAGGR